MYLRLLPLGMVIFYTLHFLSHPIFIIQFISFCFYYDFFLTYVLFILEILLYIF